jgi:hypothetical protein
VQEQQRKSAQESAAPVEAAACHIKHAPAVLQVRQLLPYSPTVLLLHAETSYLLAIAALDDLYAEPIRPHVQELSFNGSWPQGAAHCAANAQQQQHHGAGQLTQSTQLHQHEQEAAALLPAAETAADVVASSSASCVLHHGGHISQSQQAAGTEGQSHHSAHTNSTSTNINSFSRVAAAAAADGMQQHSSRSPRQQRQRAQRQHQTQQQQQQQAQHATQQQQLPPQCSQSCSVPTDLEVMDQLLDQLVLLDPKISKALANAPRVQFETFRPAAEEELAASKSPRGGADDINRTFLTACSVPDAACTSPQQEQQRQQPAFPAGHCSFLPACPGAAAEPRLTPRQQQQPGSLLRQPEVACSADLFDYSMRAAVSGSYGAKGRARLHSMNLSEEVDSSSFSGAASSANGGRGHRLVHDLK